MPQVALGNTGLQVSRLSFAARLPYVHSLCIGMRSWAEVQGNAELLALAERD